MVVSDGKLARNIIDSAVLADENNKRQNIILQLYER